MAEIILATESDVSRAPQLSNRRLLNLFTEKQDAEARSQRPLFTAPGIHAYHDTNEEGTPTGPCRNLLLWQSVAYGTFGSSLYRLDDVGQPVFAGGNISGTRPVGMSENGVQIIVVNGVSGWTYDSTAGLVKITSANFYPACTVAFMDGFFIFDRRGTNQWFISRAYDGQMYDALDFASAEADPGEVTAVAANLQFLYIFTSTHFELWYNAGTSPFPFARYTGSSRPFGCISPYSVVNQDGALWFMGKDRIFYRLSDSNPERVSTHAMELIFSQESEADLALCETFTYTVQGHKMIVVTLKGGNRTVCYDISTGRWHDRDSVDADFNDLGRWRARFALYAYGKTILGDAFDSRIGYVDWSLFAEYQFPMRWEVQTLAQHKENHRIFCSRFELVMQAGVGTPTGQGQDPQVRLRKSRNGGMSFDGLQPVRSVGREGDWGKRLRWTRQGSGRSLVWKIQGSDPVPYTIIQALADLQEGLN